MKMQISGQSVRIRIDETELDQLLSGEILTDTTRFSAEYAHTRRLQLNESSDALFDGTGEYLAITLPRIGFTAFAAERPRRDAYRFTGTSASDWLSIVFDIDIDVRDSRRKLSTRPGRSDANAGSGGSDPC